MKTSEQINEIATALAKAQGELAGAKKDVSNPFFKSKYADLASIVEALKACFPKHGLSYVQTTVTTEHGAGVQTRLMHASGQWIEGDPFCLPVNKADAQGFGSCVTYARRYDLAAMTGVAPEDDDGNAAAKAPRTFPSAAIPANVEGVELAEETKKKDPEQWKWIEGQADIIRGLFHAGKNVAEHWDAQHYTMEEKLMLSTLLDAPTRRRIKDQQREKQNQKETA
jgi:hypothetical protein